MGSDSGQKDKAGRRYLIVANVGNKITELIEHNGSLKDSHQKALPYVAHGRCKIKR